MKRIDKYRMGALLLCALIAGSCVSNASPRVRPPGKDSDTAHNSRDSLDWAGTYAGITPSASGMGIEVRLTLYGNNTYALHYNYVGRENSDFRSEGRFAWDDTGNIVVLDVSDGPRFYRVGENTLRQLDMAGQAITGDLAEQYILQKE